MIDQNRRLQPADTLADPVASDFERRVGPVTQRSLTASRESNELLGEPAAVLQGRIDNLVGGELQQVETLIQEATRSRFPEVNLLCLRAANMGGKRLRPILLLLSSQASQANSACVSPKDLRAMAAAVELVHAASLVHDDVMDGATQRRHQQTIAHVEGDSAAILLGDFLFTRAYALAARCRSTYAARAIAAAATQLCEGELRQQLSATNWTVSTKQYVSILRQKTSALCEVSCRLGSGNGATQEGRKALSRFGRHLGLAFQIFDDWLDYWGDGHAGKTLGTDLAQLKPTLPLIRLLKVASPATRRRVEELLYKGDEEALHSVRQELDKSDASKYTLWAAQRCVERAKEAIAGLPRTAAKECLLSVADYSAQRNK